VTKPSPSNYRADVLDRARTKQGKIRCAKCRQSFTAGHVEVDHKRPTVDGGSDDLTNLQVLCKPCHEAKTTREAKRRARGPVWPAILQLGATLGAGAAAISHFIPFYRGVTDLHQLGEIRIPVAPLLHDTAGGGLLGLGAAATIAFAPGLGRRWIAAGAPRDTTPRLVEPVGPSAKDRIEETVREFVRNRGTITVRDGAGDAIVVTYSGTGLADEDGDTRGDLMRKLAAKTGKRWTAAWDTASDTVTLAPRRELPTTVDHPGFTPGRPWKILPVGVDEQARTATFDLNATPHLLIAGNTGKGKTSLVRALIEAARDSASRSELDLILIDPKQIEFGVYDGAPNVHAVYTNNEEIYDALIALEAEMQRRYAHYRKTWEWDAKPIIVVVDELRVLYKRLRTEAITRKESVTQSRPPAAQAALEELLFLGRSAGIHIIGGTQAPDAAWMGGDVRAQMEGRALVGPSVDGRTSRMCFGTAAYGRDIPSSALGRTTMQVLEEEPQEIQAFWVKPPKPVRTTLTKETS
jgi:hypothetical protein